MITRSQLRGNAMLRDARDNVGGIVRFGAIVVFGMAVIAIIVMFAVHGGLPGSAEEPIRCHGTTGVYREYDMWTERYERYTVPNDPACQAGGR